MMKKLIAISLACMSGPLVAKTQTVFASCEGQQCTSVRLVGEPESVGPMAEEGFLFQGKAMVQINKGTARSTTVYAFCSPKWPAVMIKQPSGLITYSVVGKVGFVQPLWGSICYGDTDWRTQLRKAGGNPQAIRATIRTPADIVALP